VPGLQAGSPAPGGHEEAINLVARLALIAAKHGGPAIRPVTIASLDHPGPPTILHNK
jgi:hypothetical protein